ncbi:MAG TPA: hypothetical protein VGO48_15670 [Conexibacter sp.]|jgi:hypothetical protein|nr:hypothetical protein [Conexibacter sp.]
MKLSKLLLTIAGATVLLGALVSSAFAGRLSQSANTLNVTFARLDFRGGLGTVECEVILNTTFHTRSINKIPLLLIGYITAASVNGCARGGMTVLRETLPWHVRYSSFAGTLPNITSIQTRTIGESYRVTEPVFGISCLSRTTPEQPGIRTYNAASGAITSATAGGTISCSPGGITGSLSGSTTNVVEVGGARLRFTLI